MKVVVLGCLPGCGELLEVNLEFIEIRLQVYGRQKSQSAKLCRQYGANITFWLLTKTKNPDNLSSLSAKKMDKHIRKPEGKSRKSKAALGMILMLAVFSIGLAIYLFTDRHDKRRPQEPTKPYAYSSEEVTFRNEQANVKLAGTLTMPSKQGNHPAVILISGSGPQNRDEEMAGHKPFLIISDWLTRNGIAVLRYDDRGVGESTGDFSSGTSLDFSTDVESAVAYLKTRTEIRKNQIGLVGHSDGAMIAPMVAARLNDIGYIVLLAGPGMPGGQLLINRQELMERSMGLSEVEIQKSKKSSEEITRIIRNSKDIQTLKNDLINYSKEHISDVPEYAIPPGMNKEQFVAERINILATPWFQYFLNYDPTSTLEKVTCPVLALNGDKDVQVPSKENLDGIRNSLIKGGNKKVTIVEFSNLNHLFQECKTGLPDEYPKIEQTFSPIVLEEISRWILKQCG